MVEYRGITRAQATSLTYCTNISGFHSNDHERVWYNIPATRLGRATFTTSRRAAPRPSGGNYMLFMVQTLLHVIALKLDLTLGQLRETWSCFTRPEGKAVIEPVSLEDTMFPPRF